MKLNINNLDVLAELKEKGYAIPEYDVSLMRRSTREAPIWIHFGAGNIFRAFIANAQQKLLNSGSAAKGIIVCDGFDYQLIDRCYKDFDNLSILATLKSNGSVEKTVTASVSEALSGDRSSPDFERLSEIFRSPSLQMASFTITEKGYALSCAKNSDSVIYKLTELCLKRFSAGAFPLALVSMDNCSKNGDKLKAAVLACAKELSSDSSFTEYLSNPDKISFPCSMIDKITPRPDSTVRDLLTADGIEDMDIIVTDKNTYSAGFVNAEECEYLVVEDLFPNGRPPLEEAGIIFTDAQTVDKSEKMKVCTCLNPLHTSLAIFGCLLGYTKISDETADSDLSALIKKIGYTEGLPVVVDPKIISPERFIDEVITLRLPNPFIPDTPQRIACDTSQKLPIRFGETIKAYAAKGIADELKYIPFTLAGWCRYLLCVDDNGEAFTPSPDPELERLTAMLSAVRLGEDCDVHAVLAPILSDSAIFASDLYKAGLGEKIEGYFAQMIKAPGAVRSSLHSLLEE